MWRTKDDSPSLPEIRIAKDDIFNDSYFMSNFRNYKEAGSVHFHFKFKQSDFVSNVLNVNEVLNWKPNELYIISAQTGSGKNSFIFDKLLPRLIEENPNRPNLILLLSNRIATSRQSKIDIADKLVSYIQDDRYVKMLEKIYTPSGVDECCVNFGVVTVSTYQQMFERQLLDYESVTKNPFKYIICDECHFFTSDGIFNVLTDRILEYIVAHGNKSVRIYMSATPDVAFQAILKQELVPVFRKREAIWKYYTKENEAFTEKINQIVREGNSITMQQWIWLYNNEPYNLSSDIMRLVERYLYALNNRGRVSYSYEVIDSEMDKHFLNVHFYYIARNYDYLIPRGTYSDNERLKALIVQSTGKWIVFVETNAEGRELEKLLNNIQKDTCVFLSRDRVNNSYSVAEHYNYIIENEKPKPTTRVLITTSLLDNGININNSGIERDEDKVLNIAINCSDRTQFIQMIGRVRRSPNTNINLYIREKSVEDLKEILENNAREVIKRLQADVCKPQQNSYPDNKLFYPYYDEYGNHICRYNDCAILQLLDQMIPIFEIIRQSDKSYCIPISRDLAVFSEILYKHYISVKGQNKPWSRIYLDLFETGFHKIQKEERIQKFMRMDENYYNNLDKYNCYSVLHDTFTSYIFSELIPEHLLKVMEDKVNSYMEKLTQEDRNLFKNRVSLELNKYSNPQTKYDKSIYLFKSCEILKHLFPDNFLDVSIDFIKTYAELIKHYEWLANNDNFSTFLDLQLSWIEKDSFSILIQSEESIDDVSNLPDTLEEFIEKYAVTEDEINEHRKNVSTNNVLDKDFLNDNAILKDSDKTKAEYLREAKFKASEISKLYFDGKPIDEVKATIHQEKLHLPIDGVELESYQMSRSSDKTFYIFVKCNDTNSNMSNYT